MTDLHPGQLPATRHRARKYSAFGASPDKNGEVDPTIFPAVSDMQLGA
jgi:hypothetical protein